MADRVGQQLGHYRLLHVLGQGAFAEVYLGEHQYLERAAAIKVLHVQMDPETQEQFRREARTIGHLHHLHIVQVLDFGLHDQTPYLVMEYIPGGTLRSRHPKGTRLPVEQIVTYVKQIASALDYAHQQRVIHRDVKPENLLLNAKDEVVLSDFGLAVVQQTLDSLSMHKPAGTPLYMAPEQIQHQPCAASDQYALGILVYEWLVGEAPFRGPLFEVFSHHLYQPPPSLRERLPDLPVTVEEAVFKALAKDPEHRFACVADFASALEEVCDATQPLTLPGLPKPRIQEPTVSPRTRFVPASTAREPEGASTQPVPMTVPPTEHGEEVVPAMAPGPSLYGLTVSEQIKPFVSQSNRQRFLRRVRAFWIHGVLEHSLHGAALIALGLQEQLDALANPWQLVLQHPDTALRSFPLGTRITDVYDATNGELLILGAPGSGKTTLLLKLARDLLDRAEHDEQHLMPVIFPLSSWTGKQPLTEWMVEELINKYQVPRQLARTWVDTEQLLPLLDGLDEVTSENRMACIDAINTYRQEHGLLPLVVSSRSADYLAQTARVRLNSAVTVQPLTPEQVDDYLVSAGDPLWALRVALHQDAALRELTETPLMLSILTLTYHDMPVEELLRGGIAPTRQQVFEHYTERMLRHRGAVMRYPQEQTTHWLSWLAKQMKQQSQTVFSLEQMQPSWLTSWQRQLYEWWAIRFPACLTGVLISLATCLAIFEFNSFFLIGNSLLGGGLGGLLSASSMTPSSRDGERGSASKHGYRVIGMFGIGVLAGLMFVLGYSHDWTSGLSLSIERDLLLRNGVSLGLIYGLCGIGLSLAVSNSHRAYQCTSLHTSLSPGRAWRRWWQHLTRHAPIRNGFLTGLILGLSVGLSDGLSTGLISGLSDGLVFGLIWGFIGGLLSVLLAGQTTMIRLLDRIQWSWKRLGHSLLSKHRLGHTLGAIILFGLISGLSFGLISGLSFGLSYGLSTGMSIGLIYWLLISLFQGVVSETMDDQHRVTPGQGIRRSAHNGLILGLTSSLVCVSIYMVSRAIWTWVSTEVGNLLWHMQAIPMPTSNSTLISTEVGNLLWHMQGSTDLSNDLYFSLPYGLVFGLACGLLVALLKGGLAWFQHATLRFLLWHTGSVPWRYVPFLDYAADHILLRKVGGGYVFVHRLLLEYFASLDTPPTPDAARAKKEQAEPAS